MGIGSQTPLAGGTGHLPRALRASGRLCLEPETASKTPSTDYLRWELGYWSALHRRRSPVARISSTDWSSNFLRTCGQKGVILGSTASRISKGEISTNQSDMICTPWNWRWRLHAGHRAYRALLFVFSTCHAGGHLAKHNSLRHLCR
jgi:hypothetical protein